MSDVDILKRDYDAAIRRQRLLMRMGFCDAEALGGAPKETMKG